MSSQSALRRFRFAAAPVDLFTDAVGGFVYPQVESLEATGAPKHYERSVLAQDHDRFQGVVGEMENVGVKFSMALRGFGGAGPGAGSAVAAGDGENGLLLKSVFGSQTKDTGSLAAGGTTAAIVKVADTALFTVGAFIGAVDPATGLYHLRQIRSKTATDLVLCRDLPFVPAVGSVVYASASYKHAIEGHQHLWFDEEWYQPTAASNKRSYIRGCLGDVAFKLDGRAMMDFTFKGVDRHRVNGTTQGAPTYPANLPPAGIFTNRRMRVWVDGAEQFIQGLGYVLGNEVQGRSYTGGAAGVSSYVITGKKDTLSFTALHDDGGAALVAKLEAGTRIDFLAEQAHGGPGNSVALAAPFVELVSYKETTKNGLDAYEFEAAIDRNDTIAGVAALTLGIL